MLIPHILLQPLQIATVTVNHDTVASAGVRDASGAGGALTLGGLLPGMLVTAKVRSVLSDGLLVTFLTYFNGERRIACVLCLFQVGNIVLAARSAAGCW